MPPSLHHAYNIKRKASETKMNSPTSTPPSTPPFDTPATWNWFCRGCRTEYKLSVTRRCLNCTVSIYTGISHSPPEVRRRRIRRQNRIPLGAFDYEYWTRHNDWCRFRSAYENDPDGWKRRAERELEGSEGGERRALMWHLERKRRIEITEERRSKFIKATYSCEKDCDYPSQCHHERWAANKLLSSLQCPGQVVGTLLPPSKREGPKSPLCRLLPDLLPELELDKDGDMAMMSPESMMSLESMASPDNITSPENIDDNDEIINAYKVCDDNPSISID